MILVVINECQTRDLIRVPPPRLRNRPYVLSRATAAGITEDILRLMASVVVCIEVRVSGIKDLFDLLRLGAASLAILNVQVSHSCVSIRNTGLGHFFRV